MDRTKVLLTSNAAGIKWEYVFHGNSATDSAHIVRLGFERYAVNTSLIADLSVDHLYLQVMLRI